MSAQRITQPQEDQNQGAIVTDVPAATPPTKPEPQPFVAPPLKKGHHDLHIMQASAKARLRMQAAHRPGFQVPHPAQHGNQR